MPICSLGNESSERSTVLEKSVASPGHDLNASNQQLEYFIARTGDIAIYFPVVVVIVSIVQYFLQLSNIYLIVFYLIYGQCIHSMFQDVVNECRRLKTERSKLLNEKEKSYHDHKILSSEKDKLAAELETLRDKAKSLYKENSSKISSRSKQISPRTVDITQVENSPSAFHADVDEDEDHDDECCDESDCSSDQQNSEVHEFSEYLTFYVGNLHYNANSYQVKKAVLGAITFHRQFLVQYLEPLIDQVVIARTSTGKSRGCAFVTMRWEDYFSFEYGSDKDSGEPVPIDLTDPRCCEYDKEIQDRFCSKVQSTRICGRRIFIEVARNQRRD